jgi:hypothetical protein
VARRAGFKSGGALGVIAELAGSDLALLLSPTAIPE